MSIVKADMVSRVDGLFSQDVDDTLIGKCLVAAVHFYSRYNPRYKRTTVDVVEDTEVYDLPDDFMFLDWFDWWPTAEPSAASPSTDAVWEAVYDQAERDAKALRLSPYIRVSGHQLILDPAPEEDADDTELAYWGVHEADIGGDYQTIPALDEPIILNLTVAELLSLRSPQITVTPDITEGLLALQWRKVPMNTAQIISMLRQSVKDKYGGH